MAKWLTLMMPQEKTLSSKIQNSPKLLITLINYQPCIDKLYLYAKYELEVKFHLLIKKSEIVGLRNCNDPNAFIENLSVITIFEYYEKISKYNPILKKEKFDRIWWYDSWHVRNRQF